MQKLSLQVPAQRQQSERLWGRSTCWSWRDSRRVRSLPGRVNSQGLRHSHFCDLILPCRYQHWWVPFCSLPSSLLMTGPAPPKRYLYQLHATGPLSKLHQGPAPSTSMPTAITQCRAMQSAVPGTYSALQHDCRSCSASHTRMPTATTQGRAL